MLLPAPGKIWPLEAFNYPKNHESHKDGDLRVIDLMFSTYMAGHPLKTSPKDIVLWVKSPASIAAHKKAALREFVDSWTFFDLWTFYFNSGCSMYEIARAMRVAGAMAPLPVHYINSVALGYSESGEGPDDRERQIHYRRFGIDPHAVWRGFLPTTTTCNRETSD